MVEWCGDWVEEDVGSGCLSGLCSMHWRSKCGMLGWRRPTPNDLVQYGTWKLSSEKTVNDIAHRDPVITSASSYRRIISIHVLCTGFIRRLIQPYIDTFSTRSLQSSRNTSYFHHQVFHILCHRSLHSFQDPVEPLRVFPGDD